eukprot:scaffold55207_cov57-Phaeocystis_antarctica.AAC.2
MHLNPNPTLTLILALTIYALGARLRSLARRTAAATEMRREPADSPASGVRGRHARVSLSAAEAGSENPNPINNPHRVSYCAGLYLGHGGGRALATKPSLANLNDPLALPGNCLARGGQSARPWPLRSTVVGRRLRP